MGPLKLKLQQKTYTKKKKERKQEMGEDLGVPYLKVKSQHKNGKEAGEE